VGLQGTAFAAGVLVELVTL
jgi:hypothetical protein